MNTDSTPADALLDLRADGPCILLTFEVGEPSKLAKRFIAELSTFVTAAQPKKPLVYSTGGSFAAVYRAVPDWSYDLCDSMGRPLFDDIGRRIADIRSDYTGRIKFAITNEFVATPDGVWAQNRTAENTPRHTLPVFDSQATSRALAGLVDRWSTEGNIVVIQPPRLARQADYASRPNTTPAKDLDPMIRLATKQAAGRGTGTYAPWLDN
jgi:hypothetical protein